MRLRFVTTLVALGIAAVAINCGMADSEDAGVAVPEGGGGTQAGSGGSADAGIDANLGDADPDASPPDYSDLCGDGCIPGLEADPCLAGDGGAGGGGGGGGATGHGGSLTCQLEYQADASAFMGGCAPTGQAEMGDSCFTNSDCGPGLACVGELGACRPYCCGPTEDCPEDTFCRPATWAESADYGASSIAIPVCWPATNCTLLEDSACADGEVCAIVRVDGTTSCVVPGPGGRGAPCSKIGDCAGGFVCSIPKGECLELCRISRASDCEEGESCQGGSTMYPPGFGVCVGGG
ncbi:MAG: hypothetical protein JRI23_13450 [Deltaproteobacteria bacterium]|jgi:hypothetical protein|nr:hypothetical protein [Deltaproteobacteria bacterium]MBW2532733.1 hypothetical protein [Deltaproteobacteria bacterium]